MLATLAAGSAAVFFLLAVVLVTSPDTEQNGLAAERLAADLARAPSVVHATGGVRLLVNWMR